MRVWFIAAALAAWTGWASAGAQETSPDSVSAQSEADSLAVLLAEVPLDSILAQLGDSLFTPSAGRARIVRDAYGVPHIYGETDADVAFGFGYAQAEDHLIPMLLNFREAKGQLSEIMGETYLENDCKALLWRIASVAGERYGDIPEPTRRLIEAFVAGINHYIGAYQPVLPDWVEPVRETDVVAFSRWIMFSFSEGTGSRELRQKGIEAGTAARSASNQWVVGPSRSATGSTMFVMDSHLPWRPPLLWYEAHLVSREGLDVAGATFFGFPVIVMGHNNRIAWSMTVNATDVFDLYEEKLDPANPKRYLYEEEKRRMSSRRVKIKVRRGKGVFEVEREMLYTHHGPVYKTMENWAYAAKTSMQDLVNVTGQLYAMNRAQDLQTFQQAMAMMELPMFNVMYGDADGNTFYVFNARCPVRSDKFDWRSVVPGWTSETEWQGVLPFSQLPQVTNPESGFMQNCNIAAHLVTTNSGIDPEAFPAYLGRGGFNDRGQRALNWLFSHDNVTVDDMLRLAKDNYLISAEEQKGIVLRAYNRTWHGIYDPDGHVATAVDLLRSWDNHATVDSRATALFAVWKSRFDSLLKQISGDQQRDVLVLEKLALESLRATVEFMMGTYGRLDVPWGEIHVIERGDGRFPVSGSPPGTTALHKTGGKLGADGLVRVTGGSSFTMVVALTQPTKAWSALPYGNSADPYSRHYTDQAELQGRDALKPAWFGENEVYANMEAVLTVPLQPEETERTGLRALWKQRERLGNGGMESEADELQEGAQQPEPETDG